MKITKFGVIGVVLSGMLLLGAEARAETVSFFTTGEFTDGDLAGSSTYLDALSGIQIDFSTSPFPQTVDVPTAANVSFGLFNTQFTTATNFQAVSSGFILNIFELTPTAGGTAQFVGSLTGQLRATNSQAYIQFDPSDLLKTIGLVTYEIVSADDGFTGRVNLPVASSNPTSIAGRVNLIPEPSAVILVSMGAVAPLALTLRRRMKGRAAA